MSELFIHLLGAFECRRDQQVLNPALSHVSQAILAYLAATNRTHARQALSELFFADAADPASSLEWHLTIIRSEVAANIIISHYDTFSFNGEAALVDSLLFEEHTASGNIRHALHLYHGEFLQGFRLPDAPAFEMWLLGERYRLKHHYERVLTSHVDSLISDQVYDEAIGWAEDLVESNPVLEMAHARLMWLYVMLGQQDDALEQFKRCQHILARELAVEPSGELVNLYEQIAAGDIAPRMVKRPTADPLLEYPPPPALVGREAELQMLYDAWQSGAAMVILKADAGGGKTSLVETFGEQIPDTLLVSGRCYESSQHIPYYPWLTLLERYIQTLDDGAWSHIAPFWLRHLKHLLPNLAERRRATDSNAGLSEIKEEHFLRSVSELLLRLPERPPLIVFLDDLQWADEASLRLLQYLMLESQSLRNVPPVMLIGALRATENPAFTALLQDIDGYVTLLELAPLDARAIKSLIRWHQLDVAAEDILKATGGNPLHVVELLNEIAHEAQLSTLPGLNALFERRLSRLTASSRQVMEAIAVFDAPLAPPMAMQTSGRSDVEVEQAIDAGLRGGFLQAIAGTPQVDFRHDLLRDTMRQQLTALRCQHLHERAANTLTASSAPASQIAYHWQMAGNDPQEGYFSMLAGKEAAKVFAHDDAVRYLQRALELVQDSEFGADILLRIGNVRFATGEWAAAEARYRVALVLSAAEKLRPQHAATKYQMALLKRNKGDYSGALKAFKEALALYEELGDRKGRMLCMGGIGSIYLKQADYDEALQSYETQYVMALDINDLQNAIVAQGSVARIYLRLGNANLALRNLEEALAQAHRINDLGHIGKLNGTLGIAYQQVGDYENALQGFVRQLDNDKALGDPRGMITAVSNIAAMCILLGHDEAAWHCSIYQLQHSLDANDQRLLVIALNRMSRIDGRRDNHARAGRLSQLSIALARSLGIEFHLSAWLHQEAVRLRDHNEIRVARAANHEALTMAREVGRNDIAFDAQLLEIELKFRSGEQSADAALAELQARLDHFENKRERAALFYFMWRIDASRPAAAEQASAIYRELYAALPDILYRDRFHELTGENLPLATEPPQLPDFITQQSTGVDELIAHVEAVLHSRNA